ncbi:Type II secretion system protein G precursor [Planctomycetes bacterium Pla163]|uniref:Type II secretion system protein G n=1 Tax=Rohdeia mirabilis TaxID=2528008 RepID=A0A518CXD1_9BACT|nr:Type II secretion system protein G precursor [Planctomycetes bacterium Pla163]
MSIRPRPAAVRRGGFTLLELLAVMVVLGILVAFLVPNLLSTQETAEIKATEVRLTQIATAIDSFERERGTYPPSSFLPEWGVAPNDLNVGIECLVLSLWSNNWEAGGQLSADDLVNTDGDRSAGAISDLPNSQLLEFVDSWENPIAYIQNSDYGTEHRYLAYDDEGLENPNVVTARRNEATGRYANHAKYQLISAGPDGTFETEDDIYYPSK